MPYKDVLKQRENTKKWRDNYPEYLREWKLANPDNVKRHTRTSRLKREYGIKLADYEQLLNKQEGRCALCGTENPGRNLENFSVDHCHKTGKIRALLCHRCNTGLGSFKDDPDLLEKAAEYIRTR